MLRKYKPFNAKVPPKFNCDLSKNWIYDNVFAFAGFYKTTISLTLSHGLHGKQIKKFHAYSKIPDFAFEVYENTDN